MNDYEVKETLERLDRAETEIRHAVEANVVLAMHQPDKRGDCVRSIMRQAVNRLVDVHKATAFFCGVNLDSRSWIEDFYNTSTLDQQEALDAVKSFTQLNQLRNRISAHYVEGGRLTDYVREVDRAFDALSEPCNAAHRALPVFVQIAESWQRLENAIHEETEDHRIKDFLNAISHGGPAYIQEQLRVDDWAERINALAACVDDALHTAIMDWIRQEDFSLDRCASGDAIGLSAAPRGEARASGIRFIAMFLNSVCQTNNDYRREAERRIAASVADSLHTIRTIEYSDAAGRFGIDMDCLEMAQSCVQQILDVDGAYKGEGKAPPLSMNVSYWIAWLETIGPETEGLRCPMLEYKGRLYDLIEISALPSVLGILQLWSKGREVRLGAAIVQRLIVVGYLCREWIKYFRRLEQAKFARSVNGGIDGGVTDDDVRWLEKVSSVAELSIKVRKLFN